MRIEHNPETSAYERQTLLRSTILRIVTEQARSFEDANDLRRPVNEVLSFPVSSHEILQTVKEMAGANNVFLFLSTDKE